MSNIEVVSKANVFVSRSLAEISLSVIGCQSLVVSSHLGETFVYV